MSHSLCVFTPTYNRAYSLEKLYKSLAAQTSHDFYWLIVDDGSTDNTADLANSFAAENKIDIEYVKTLNGGKQRAWNVAASRCKADLFMCVDSDDHLTRNAIESVLQEWSSLPPDCKIAGIVTPRAARNEHFPSGVKLRLSQLYSDFGYRGETCIATKTSIIKAHPFLVPDGEKFMPELFVFDQIDQTSVHLALNKEICIGEYLEDGYTAHYGALLASNPLSFSLYKLQCAKFALKVADVLRETFLYLSWTKIGHGSVLKAAKEAPHRTLAYILAPCAAIAALPVKELVKRS